jgi:BMFP domain-containing protein YqiC
MISVMNKKITLDVLAVMIQKGFLDLARQISSLKERMQMLTLRIDALEERTENGFYNVTQELQQIRQLIKKVDTREKIAALEVRVDAIEKKIG